MRTLAVVALPLAAGACMSDRAGAAPAGRVNVIFVLTDDLGYGDLGCYGQKTLTTPHIDRMAREGMRFTRGYSGSTVCAPSRCTLMTGKHTGHSRVRGNGHALLTKDDVTVGDLFRRAGYVTGGFGKWGVGQPPPPDNPNRHGFDEFYGYVNMCHAHNFYPEFLIHNGIEIKLRNVLMPEYRNLGHSRRGAGVAEVAVDYAPDLIREKMFAFLDANHAKPFFMMYMPNTPHANNEGGRHGRGMEVPDFGEFADRDWPKQEKGFAKMIRDIDDDIGKLMARLKRHGIDDRTLLIFSSDNGPHREGGHKLEFFDSNGEKRGLKRDLYEGGVRVPFIARWPGRVPAGKVNKSIVAFQDFMPTCAELIGEEPPENDGLSMLPALTGEKMDDSNRTLYWEFGEGGGKQAIIKGDWKLVRMPMRNPRLELYNDARDPREERNLIDEYPEKAKELFDEMVAIPDANTIFRARVTGTFHLDGKKPAGRELARKGWKAVRADSVSEFNKKFPRNVLDGKPDTIWHSKWMGGIAPQPHEIVIDTAAEREFTGIGYLPRSDGGNGTIMKFEVHIMNGPEAAGTLAASGEFPADARYKVVAFPKPVRGRYVKLRSLTAVGGGYTSAAEIKPFGR
ncbi:MAG: sulfatase-like hydrolase/transferase [Planctomycetota bacterium]|jgi:arylsulfatase A-like enzyme